MATVVDARVAVLGRLIDHAPLYPPASLVLHEALDEDRRARASDSAFALGRFVCPASLVDELPEVGRGLSVVLDSTSLPSPDVRVEAVETTSSDLASLVGVAPEIYVEVPLDDGLEERLDALVATGLRAKVRCGGASVPTTVELARFVRACGERGLVFKATAGLHHAVRRDGEHGFLNLLAAVVFTGEEAAVLSEADAAAFSVTADRFVWRDRDAVPAELERARRDRLHSIGSCSFFEPISELEAMGVLPL